MVIRYYETVPVKKWVTECNPVYTEDCHTEYESHCHSDQRCVMVYQTVCTNSYNGYAQQHCKNEPRQHCFPETKCHKTPKTQCQYSIRTIVFFTVPVNKSSSSSVLFYGQSDLDPQRSLREFPLQMLYFSMNFFQVTL